MAGEHEVEVLDTFICPACHVTVTIGRSADGDGIYHPLPMCETYEKLPAEEYGELLKKSRS